MHHIPNVQTVNPIFGGLHAKEIADVEFVGLVVADTVDFFLGFKEQFWRVRW